MHNINIKRSFYIELLKFNLMYLKIHQINDIRKDYTNKELVNVI